jgi:cation diffusion facilitator family transporter
MSARLARYRPLFLSDPASRAAVVPVISNSVVLLLKLVVGIITGSIAVLSDAVDSAEDIGASSFDLWSVRLSAKPADLEHPYGHGKAEGIAAAAEALLIGAGGVFIFYQALHRLVGGGEAKIDIGLGIVAMAITAAVNLSVAFYLSRVARATGSLALAAGTRHLWTNLVQAAAVIVALALVGLTGRREFDAIVALVLSGFLIFSATRIALGASRQIMDVRLPPEEEDAILETILRYGEDVRGFHKLRTRRSGRQRYVELHLIVNASKSVREMHAICDRIEKEIIERLPGAEVTIHVEPDDGRYTQPRPLPH